MLIRFADSSVRGSAHSAAVVCGATALIASGGLFVAAPASADEPPGGSTPHWDNAIGQPEMNGSVTALAVFDDGSGVRPCPLRRRRFYHGGRGEREPHREMDPDDCPADLNNDETVDGTDLLILLSNWG